MCCGLVVCGNRHAENRSSKSTKVLYKLYLGSFIAVLSLHFAKTISH